MCASGVSPTGAYGLAIDGAPQAARPFLGKVPPHWPRWTVVRHDGTEASWDRERLTSTTARLRTSGEGWLEADANRSEAHVWNPLGGSQEAFVHPQLGLLGALVAFWAGNSYLHAGSIVIDGEVWGILGPRSAGKTSFLMMMRERAGFEIWADDVLIIDQSLTCFAGPRCADLREDVAIYLSLGSPIGLVGGRERWRVPLSPVPGELPLGGWIALEWGDALTVEAQPPSAGLPSLMSSLAIRLPPRSPLHQLRLLDRPFIRLSRRRDFDAFDETSAALLEYVRAVSL